MPVTRRVARWISTALLAGLIAAVPVPAVADPDENSCTANPQPIDEQSWIPAFLDISAANEIATGKGITVAVVDSGVDITNPHLLVDGAVKGGKSLVADDAAADGTEDFYGHGTVIAGVIAARPVEGSSVHGVAPDATILPVRVFRAVSEDSAPDPKTVAQGIRYAAEQHAQIINVSISSNWDVPELRAAVEYATAQGSLVVASAGNRATTEDKSDSLRYPAAYPQVLGVAAIGTDWKVSESSIHGPQVGISAPGEAVVSTVAGGIDCVYSTDEASTSWATAYASGAAALVAERYPEEGPDGWRERLEVTASRAVPDERNDLAGWGVIRPYDALTTVIDASVPGAEGYRPPSQAAAKVTIDTGVDPRAQTRGLVGIVLGIAVLVWALLWMAASTRAHRRANSS